MYLTLWKANDLSQCTPNHSIANASSMILVFTSDQFKSRSEELYLIRSFKT